MSTLKERIQNKTATLGVCGLGYVGLPLAVEKAKSVARDLQRYARTNPRDEGEDYDMLACYCWYSYDGARNHLVFVQGEN